MGALVGLLLGTGLLLVLHARGLLAPTAAEESPSPFPATVAPARASWLRVRLDRAGLADLGVVRVVLTSAGTGLAAAVIVLVLTASPVVALAFAVIATALPLAAVGHRAARRHAALAAAWPDAVDDLASAVRAGMSLPDAVAALSERGPAALREPFGRFAADYRVTGSFGVCLDRLKADLGDPVGDRVVEALRLARDVGGTELGRLLRTLSAVLREDARTRGELLARQSWAVNAARIAAAAPWATLLLLSLRPGALAAYDSAGGALVLGLAAGASAGAYVLMLRIGRLPTDERVLS